uniref:RING-type domain-containing protein n=1 Tax=Triticum urartu TaxID=4572 RepID=A0A8R7QK13_TRIUA
MFGTTFGDLFEDLEALQGEPQDVEALQVEPPPPRDLSLVPTALVPLQGPPPQFVAPRLAHYGNATRPMQFAARPQHMRFHVSAPGRPALFIDVQWRYEVTPPQRYDDFAPTPPMPSFHPQGQGAALQGPLPQFVPPRLGIQPHLAPYGNAAPHHHAAIQRCQDCWIRPPAVQLDPCGHVSLCGDCYDRRQHCPCCGTWIEWGPVYNLSA